MSADPEVEEAALAFLDHDGMYAAAERSTNPETLRLMAEAAADRGFSRAASAVVANPHTEHDTIYALCDTIGRDDPGMWELFARHPNADQRDFIELVGYDNTSRGSTGSAFAVAVGGRSDIDAHVAEYLADDEDMNIRMAIAANEGVDEGILLRLSTDENDKVREAVVSNRNASGEAFRNIFNLRNAYFSADRWTGFAKHSNMPADALVVLASPKNPSKDIRCSAMTNPNFPRKEAMRLRNDPSPTIRRCAYHVTA